MKLDAFKALAARPGSEVEILAVDPIIYLLRCSDANGDSQMLTRRGKRNWVFKSLGACQRLLQTAGIEKAVLVQESAYSEIVGMESSAGASQMRMPLHIPPADERR
ncbi:MAG: DUF6482 family protein [Pseudomonadota bacterium]